jgi:predicted component of type VI protein secretion system
MSRTAYQREWYQRNKERHRVQTKAYRQQNPEKIREIKRKAKVKMRLAVIAKLGGKCSRCPITDPRVLQINHINGDAILDRVKPSNHLKNEYRFYKSILDGERTDLNLLCANCNIIYEYEIGRRKRNYLL